MDSETGSGCLRKGKKKTANGYKKNEDLRSHVCPCPEGMWPNKGSKYDALTCWNWPPEDGCTVVIH